MLRQFSIQLYSSLDKGDGGYRTEVLVKKLMGRIVPTLLEENGNSFTILNSVLICSSALKTRTQQTAMKVRSFLYSFLKLALGNEVGM